MTQKQIVTTLCLILGRSTTHRSRRSRKSPSATHRAGHWAIQEPSRSCFAFCKRGTSSLYFIFGFHSLRWRRNTTTGVLVSLKISLCRALWHPRTKSSSQLNCSSSSHTSGAVARTCRRAFAISSSPRTSHGSPAGGRFHKSGDSRIRGGRWAILSWGRSLISLFPRAAFSENVCEVEILGTSARVPARLPDLRNKFRKTRIAAGWPVLVPAAQRGRGASEHALQCFRQKLQHGNLREQCKQVGIVGFSSLTVFPRFFRSSAIKHSSTLLPLFDRQ